MSIVILPLAFRISLPALNNNLVNLVKTTTLAYAIAVPEMLYVANQIWSDELNVPEMMNVLLIIYVGARRRPGLRDDALGAGDAHPGVRAVTLIADRSRSAGAAAVPARRGARGCAEPGARAARHGARARRRARASRSASATRSGRARRAVDPGDARANGRRCSPRGFLLNIAISFLAMAIGTALGTLLGLAQISLLPPGARLLLVR